MIKFRQLRRIFTWKSTNQRRAAVIGTLVWFISSLILWETLGDFVYRLFQSQFAGWMVSGIIGGILGVLTTEMMIKLLDRFNPDSRQG